MKAPSHFVSELNLSLFTRACIFLGVIAIWTFSATILTPYWRSLVHSFVFSFSDGQRTLIRHLFFNSFANTAVAALMLIALIKFKILQPIHLRGDSYKKTIAYGLVTGTAVSIVTIIFAWAFSPNLFFVRFDIWSTLGNLFSNAGEELQYSALFFATAVLLTKRIWTGAIIVGVIFGLSHSDYPLAFRILTGVAGFLFSTSYAQTGSVLAPYIAHQLSDIILDTLLAGG